MALGVRVGLAVPEGLAVVVAEAVELPAEPEALKEDVLEAVEELVAVKLPVPDTEGELDAEAVLVELAVPVLVEGPVELGVLVLVVPPHCRQAPQPPPSSPWGLPPHPLALGGLGLGVGVGVG